MARSKQAQHGSFLRDKQRLLVILAIGAILSIAFGSYFVLQSIVETSVRNALLEQQQQRQMGNTRALSEHIASDVDSIIARLQLLASQPSIQNGDLTSDITTSLLREADADINKVSLVDGIRLVNEQNILVNTSFEEYRKFIGQDKSEMEYVQEIRRSLKPYVSSGYVGVTGTYYVAIGVPVINEENGEYIGIAVTVFPTIEYFERYGNVLDINSEYIVALDREGNFIAAPNPDVVVGKNFFSPEIQQLIGENPLINDVYKSVIGGKPNSAVFSLSYGEKLLAGYPVMHGDEQVMSVLTGTPTTVIYSQVDKILAASMLRAYTLLSAVSAAIIILIVVLVRWNKSLDAAVKQRTAELKISSEELAQANTMLSEYNAQLGNALDQVYKANERLEAHDKMQTEFINIAAHELRTPVQPLLGIAYLLETNMKDSNRLEVSRHEIEMIIRNSRRLERLSSDILEVSQIESQSLNLNKEMLDLNRKIEDVASDAKSFIPADKNVNIIIEPCKEPLHVYADKPRLFEVISNLIKNAVKFTDSGIITVKADKQDGYAVVSVEDTGRGIDPDIIPRLFTKFASKSETGTGLGLFISKNIIEAHEGRIWGENNKHGRGATFAFTLPLGAAISGQ